MDANALKQRRICAASRRAGGSIVQREAVIATMAARVPALLREQETIMIDKAVAVFIAGFCLLAPARADEATPDNAGGRYTFNKVADGFLRLDMQTGEVSLCGQRSVGWTCQAAPEDRAVLENEIARLRIENAALKKDILARGLPLPAGALPEPPPVREGDRLPPGVNSDLHRMMAFVGRVWHRLVEAIAQAQKQALNKS
jgi:hypothetical protein